MQGPQMTSTTGILDEDLQNGSKVLQSRGTAWTKTDSLASEEID